MALQRRLEAARQAERDPRRPAAARAPSRLHPRAALDRRRSCRWESSGTRCRGSRSATPTAAAASPTTGPGQLVAYPIVSLRPYGDDVHAYVRGLERVAISALAEHGVEAGTIEGLTGVWVGERKIGSIGVHVSRGVTTHGLAINVNNDLQPFEWIVPCGIEGCRVTSLSRELGAEQDLDALRRTLVAARFGEVFEREPVETEARPAGARPAATLGSAR